MREKWQAGSRGEVDKRSEVHEHVTFRTGRVGLLDWLRWHSRRMVRRYGYEVKWIQMDGNGDLSVCEWSGAGVRLEEYHGESEVETKIQLYTGGHHF
jgi:hypothetical protein